MSSTHIRPRIRKSNAKAAKNPTRASADESMDALESKMGSWMGISSVAEKTTKVTAQPDATVRNMESASANMSSPESVQTTTAPEKKTVGILKKPKYSSTGISKSDSRQQQLAFEEETMDEGKKSSRSRVVCEKFVVERDPFQKPIMRNKTRPRKKPNIERFQPTAATSSVAQTPSNEIAVAPTKIADANLRKEQTKQEPQGDSDESKIILNSFEELFEAAGNDMPKDRTTVTPDSQLVEADLAFSVMTKEQYGKKMTTIKREMETEKEEMYQMFMGKDNVFGDERDGSSDDDSEGEEEFFNFLMEQEMDLNGEDYYQDDDDENDDIQEVAPRSFALIWGTLLRWLTPETAQWMKRLEHPETEDAQNPLYGNNWSPHVDRSDIGASRCAGVMAMVKLYLPSSMRELGFAPDTRRTAENRIANLLRTFDYSTEAPKLPTSLWKAISCILLDMVLVESRSATVQKIPPSVEIVGMTIDEYKYLARSAIQTLQP